MFVNNLTEEGNSFNRLFIVQCLLSMPLFPTDASSVSHFREPIRLHRERSHYPFFIFFIFNFTFPLPPFITLGIKQQSDRRFRFLSRRRLKKGTRVQYDATMGEYRRRRKILWKKSCVDPLSSPGISQWSYIRGLDLFGLCHKNKTRLLHFILFFVPRHPHKCMAKQKLLPCIN